MAESTRARNEANSIVQKFIKGSDEIPPIPLIISRSKFAKTDLADLQDLTTFGNLAR